MAAFKVTAYRLTPKARSDLEDIWFYSFQQWSADQADHYIDALTAGIDVLVQTPAIARERSEFTPPVRIFVCREHLLIYRIDGAAIEIVRILGSRQNWMQIMRQLD